MATKNSKSAKPKTTAKKKVTAKKVVAKKLPAKQLVQTIKRKSIVSKPKSSTKSITPKPIQLNEEHEQRMAEWKAKEADKDSFIAVWAAKLANTGIPPIQ